MSYCHNKPLNTFQKFQSVNGWIYKVLGPETPSTEKEILRTARSCFVPSIFLWPLPLFVTILGWIIYGIMYTAIGIGTIIVFLAKLFFAGGLLKLIGLANYKGVLIAISLLGTIIGFIYLKSRDAKFYLVITTLIAGTLTIIFALFSDPFFPFWIVWIIWSAMIILCSLLDLK